MITLFKRKYTLLKKGMLIITMIALVSTTIPASTTWEVFEGLSDYAPNGVPDFDQRQDEDWFWFGHMNYCGACSAANILWYLDSRHGDSWDLVPSLVPGVDDHDEENVVPLIEAMADYTLTDIYGTTSARRMRNGLVNWIDDQGYSSSYNVQWIKKPTFSTITNAIGDGDGDDNVIILYLHTYNNNNNKKNLHWVAVQGYLSGSTDKIKICDPCCNAANPDSENQYFTQHNDAYYVSHDPHDIADSSHWWEANIKIVDLWESYGNGEYCSDAHVTDAIIIEDLS
jgi:hypothetical protein